VHGEPLGAIVKELDLRRIDLVKIDVEGWELQVLRGMAANSFAGTALCGSVRWPQQLSMGPT
jgi:FkbM family methyltransferase